MAGILIYSEKEAKRNAFAIEKFKKELDVKLYIDDFNGNADFVINRTNNYKIAEKFEKRGIRVFNPSALSLLANNKQLCYEFMEKNGIEIMPINYTDVPAVKKPIDGHGGQGVIMINEKENFESGFVYQKPCATLGKDLRVWAIGGEIITSILRESDTDFRSNFCLGGRATPYKMNESEKALVKKILSLVKSDYIGVDFLFDGDKLIFNEIEDTVGARMVYEKTDIEILKIYCDYIKSVLQTGC